MISLFAGSGEERVPRLHAGEEKGRMREAEEERRREGGNGEEEGSGEKVELEGFFAAVVWIVLPCYSSHIVVKTVKCP